MTDNLMGILQWLLPSGGIGAVVVWLTNKTLRNLRTSKEVHDTYKKMYDDVQSTLLEIRRENNELYQLSIQQRQENEKMLEAIASLKEAISKAKDCEYWHNCPIHNELRQQEGGSRRNIKVKNIRQPRIRDQGNENDDNTLGPGVDDSSDSEDVIIA